MLKYSVLCTVILASLPCHAQFAGSRELDYPLGGVQLGNGWSSLDAAKTAGGCIEFTEKVDLAEDRTLIFKRVVDKEQLNRTLDISVEVQAKAIAGVGASAKVSFTKALEVKNDALNLAAIARVRQGARYTAPKEGMGVVKLTDAALDRLSRGMQEFTAVCGDGFVSAIYAGGELNAVLEFNLKSTDERESVSSQLTASGLAYSGSVKTTNTMKKYRESSQLRILTHSAGGSGVPLAIDEAGLLDRIKGLPADAVSAPRNYAISVTRYDKVANWPVEPLPTLRFAEMDALVAQFLRYQSLYLDMFDMIQVPENYSFVSGEHVSRVSAVHDNIRMKVMPSLEARLKECLRGESCALPDAAQMQDYEVRSTLPVKTASMPRTAKFQAAQAEMSAALEHLNSTPPTRIVIRGTYASRQPNPAYRAAQDRVVAVRQRLRDLFESYPKDVALEMYQQWIRIPSYHRCVENGTSDYCLFQEQLNTYRTNMIADMQALGKGREALSGHQGSFGNPFSSPPPGQ